MPASHKRVKKILICNLEKPWYDVEKEWKKSYIQTLSSDVSPLFEEERFVVGDGLFFKKSLILTRTGMIFCFNSSSISPPPPPPLADPLNAPPPPLFRVGVDVLLLLERRDVCCCCCCCTLETAVCIFDIACDVEMEPTATCRFAWPDWYDEVKRNTSCFVKNY